MISKNALGMATFMVVAAISSVQAQDLWLDFNSLSQDNGPHPNEAYQQYDAGHEVTEDFVTQEYDAFGATISFTPSWPDSTDNRTMQMIDRTSQDGLDEDGFPLVSGHDANWLLGDPDLVKETGSLDLVTDWIGVDTRTGNGGNGDYDGDVGDPTRILFTLSGIPAGEYSWTSFHHDTENIHTEFLLDYSVDAGASFEAVGDEPFKMTNSGTGSNPPEPQIYDGLNDDFEAIPLTDLPSTVQFNLNTTGEDVVLQFTPLSAEAVHTQIMGINGFQLAQLSVSETPTCVVPEGGLPGDLDGDGSVAFLDFLALANNFGASDVSYEQGDIDCDGTVAFLDFLALANNFGKSATTSVANPEPSGLPTIAMGFGILGLLRRRR